MNMVWIMRGVSGSGKSTYAEFLASENGVIHSTDSYFYDSNGTYMFNPNRLKEYHRRNFFAFINSLEKGIPVVICDNTNIKHWHYEKYVKVAQAVGYTVKILAMDHPKIDVAAKRNIHNVSVEIISRQIREWEP